MRHFLRAGRNRRRRVSPAFAIAPLALGMLVTTSPAVLVALPAASYGLDGGFLHGPRADSRGQPAHPPGRRVRGTDAPASRVGPGGGEAFHEASCVPLSRARAGAATSSGTRRQRTDRFRRQGWRASAQATKVFPAPNGPLTIRLSVCRTQSPAASWVRVVRAMPRPARQSTSCMSARMLSWAWRTDLRRARLAWLGRCGAGRCHQTNGAGVAPFSEDRVYPRRSPGTEGGRSPTGVLGPPHKNRGTSLTMFVVPHKSARCRQICAHFDRHLHTGRRSKNRRTKYCSSANLAKAFRRRSVTARPRRACCRSAITFPSSACLRHETIHYNQLFMSFVFSLVRRG